MFKLSPGYPNFIKSTVSNCQGDFLEVATLNHSTKKKKKKRPPPFVMHPTISDKNAPLPPLNNFEEQ